MKNVTVTATFPDVIVDNYSFVASATSEASTLKAAISRAIGTILKRPELKRKRIVAFTLEIAAPEKETKNGTE